MATYYRVKSKYDGQHLACGKTLIKNELFTPAEMKKYNISTTGSCTQSVNVSRKNIYFFFGARFECGTDHNTNLG